MVVIPPRMSHELRCFNGLVPLQRVRSAHIAVDIAILTALIEDACDECHGDSKMAWGIPW